MSKPAPVDASPPPRRDDDERSRLIRRLERLAWLLDTSVPIPFTRFRAGLDSLIGLIPGIGDAAGAALSTSILIGAWRLGVPTHRLATMLGRIVIETLIGMVPLAGDLFDIGYKANRRNVRTLIATLEGAAPTPPRRWSVLVVLVSALVAGLAIGVTLLLAAVLWSAASALFG